MGENMFGELENTFDELANMFSELENTFGELANTFGELEKMFDELENTFNELANTFGELEKTFGELENTCSVTTLVEVIMKWRKNPMTVSGDLNHSGEKMEKNYGNQNFIHHKVESTYLRRFKDRNV